MINYLMVFMILILSVFWVIYVKFSKEQKWMTRYITSQKYLIAIILVLLVLRKFLKFIQEWMLKNILYNLDDKLIQKQKHLKLFLRLIGDDMVSMVIENEKQEVTKKLTEDESKIKELEKRTSLTEHSRLQFIQDLERSEKRAKILEEFINELGKFNWCDKCYNEDMIREYYNNNKTKLEANKVGADGKELAKPEEIKKEETKKEEAKKEELKKQEQKKQEPKKEEAKKEGNKEIPKGNCLNDCLIRYHIFCDSLNKEIQLKFASIKN